jgi:nucleotide-binding universal stress UspA family protein
MTKKHAARPIVVGVDGTDDAINAARWAAGLAVAHGEPLHLVQAMRGVDEALLIVASGRQDDDAAEYPRELGQAVLDRAADAVHADFPTLNVSRTLSHRSAKDALVEYSCRAGMVVLACTDVSAGGALLVGSTTLAVATHGACPVIAWRGKAVAPNDKPVVVGIDAEQISHPALATAFELADCLGVGLTVVYALSARRAAGEVDIPILIDWEALEEEARQRLMDIVSIVADRWPTVRISYVVEMGRASRMILSRAFGAQIVVLGSRGRGGLASVLLGSTGLGLLHHSPVPVVICPGAGASAEPNPPGDQLVDRAAASSR